LLFLAAESEELCLFLALNADELAGTPSPLEFKSQI
jgi:hypothetical protein